MALIWQPKTCANLVLCRTLWTNALTLPNFSGKHFKLKILPVFTFSKTIPKSVLGEIQQSTIGHTQALKLPVKTRWFSNWTLLNSIKSNESCLNAAIWSPIVKNNATTDKQKNKLKKVKQILCDDADFWESLVLIEELLRPLKSAILAIEGSVVDLCKAFKSVGSAFDEAVEIASKFPAEQVDNVKEVLI